MNQDNLKHLHAFNVLLSGPGQWRTLKKIDSIFKGDWTKAWLATRTLALLPSTERSAKQKIEPAKEWNKLQSRSLTLLDQEHPDYPPLLKNISDPPWLLYVKGSVEILKKPSLAVVGTRKFTEYGKRSTPWLVEKISRAGLVIVSGLALGIDSFAHRATLQAGGLTIAVLGGGISNYSIVQDNRQLAQDILKSGGSIVSEYPPEAHASKITFPQRNRIISGLSLGTLVIEADEKSGSLITARLALEQGREVFALPGSIFSDKSKGPHNLLKMGAKTTTQPEDILTELGFSFNSSMLLLPSFDSPLEKQIAQIVGQESRTSDEIIHLSGQPAPEIISCLMQMELEDKIINLGQNRFSLNPKN